MRLSLRLLRLTSPMLHVSHPHSLFDAPIAISASQLKPQEEYVVKSRVEHRQSRFEAVARYVADADGCFHCDRQPSIGGSFQGVHPMGLFWALRPVEGSRKGAIFMPHSVEPITVDLLLYSFGKKMAEPCRKEEEERHLVDERRLVRHFVHPGVERREVRESRLRGALFAPKDPGDRKLPAIIDIYGTGGGLPQPRAALMASKGFVVLALAVFAYEDLPRDLKNGVHIEYFLEGIEWLERQSFVDPERIGMIGCSFGAIISLMTATFTPQLKAVASINGFHLLDSLTPLNYQGLTLPNLTGDVSLREVDPGGTLSYRVYRKSIPHTLDDVIPVERTRAPLLFLAGEDDECSPTDESSGEMMERLRRAGREAQGERIVYPQAGHLLEPPYIPQCTKSWHNVLALKSMEGNEGAYMRWGGTAEGQNAAQEAMWHRLTTFWTQHLGPPINLPPPQFTEESYSGEKE